jgi:protease-4
MMPPPGMYPPGPMFPPPMMMPPPGFFRPQRSFARAVFTTLATAVLGLSITLNIYLLAFSSLGGMFGGGAQGITETVLVEGSLEETVAVIPVTGVIMRPTAERFDQMLTAAERDRNVKAIVIDVDTPGGAVTPSDEIHARIQRFKAQNPKRPVVVTMGGMATSGGYYIACAGNYVFAQPTTLTGNIGVILPRYNFSKLAKSYGVEEVTVAAPAHGYKNAGSPMAPISPEDDKYYQGLIDQAYGTFKSVVAAGRQGKLNPKYKIEDIANGKVYTAAEAKDLGLVDEVKYASDAYDKAASLAGLTNKHVVRFSKPQGFLELLSGGQSKSGLGGGGAGAVNLNGAGGVTVNGINVNIDSTLLDDLGRPRLMYLWRGQ